MKRQSIATTKVDQNTNRVYVFQESFFELVVD